MKNKIKIVYQNKKFFVLEDKQIDYLTTKKFGTKNKDILNLDIFETYYLFTENKADVFEKNFRLKQNDILKKTKFDNCLFIIYNDLISRGYYLKAASKYGTHFRVYEKGFKDDDHSFWSIFCIFEDERIKILDLMTKIRIANSTKKKFLLGIVDRENSITYIDMNRVRL